MYDLDSDKTPSEEEEEATALRRNDANRSRLAGSAGMRYMRAMKFLTDLPFAIP